MTRRRKNAADPKKIEEDKIVGKVTEENRLKRWASVLHTEDGSRVLREILEGCYMYMSAFTGNSATFYNNGMEDMGKNIINTITKVYEVGGISREHLAAFLITRIEQEEETDKLDIGRKHPSGDYLDFFDDYEVS